MYSKTGRVSMKKIQIANFSPAKYAIQALTNFLITKTPLERGF
jgi:hypothetical protein